MQCASTSFYIEKKSKKNEKKKKRKIWKMFLITTSRHFSDLYVKINVHFLKYDTFFEDFFFEFATLLKILNDEKMSKFNLELENPRL